MSTEAFVHLRARSPYSLLEGATRIPELAELCRSKGMPALALTDSNNLFWRTRVFAIPLRGRGAADYRLYAGGPAGSGTPR